MLEFNFLSKIAINTFSDARIYVGVNE